MRTGRNQSTDDDLISAYIDGQLGPDERAAFEARLQAEPALKRHVDATRLVVGMARQLPVVQPPRNFTLPIPADAPKTDRTPRPAPAGQWLLRLGSAAAVVVFVFALAADLGYFAVPSMPFAGIPSQAVRATVQVHQAAQAPKAALEAAPTPAPAPQPFALQEEPAEAEVQVEVEPSAAAEAEQAAAAESAPAEGLPPPAAARADAAATSAAQAPTAQAPAAQAPAEPTPSPTEKASAPKQALESTPTSLPTMEPTAVESERVAPKPPPALPTSPAVYEPPLWPRVLAAAALMAAIVLGVLGWRKP